VVPREDGGCQQDSPCKRLDRALTLGLLHRPSICEQCGSNPGTDRLGRSLIRGYHHKGPKFPLEVQWLCVTCLNRLTKLKGKK
jgi:hypothetical protein